MSTHKLSADLGNRKHFRNESHKSTDFGFEENRKRHLDKRNNREIWEQELHEEAENEQADSSSNEREESEWDISSVESFN